MGKLTDEENTWKRDVIFLVGIDWIMSHDLEVQVRMVYQWPKKINEIIDEAER